MRLRWSAVAVAALLVLPAAGCRRAPTFNGVVAEPGRAPLDLAGINWDGHPYRSADHRGKVIVVFFGYTYCPDVCPFTLAKMKQLYGRLGPHAADVEVVFVSVDPQRDTVDKLARYVPSFDPRFYGLRLEPKALDATAGAFEVAVQYGPKEAGTGPGGIDRYYVDHTATFFVLDRDGRLRLKFPPSATVDQMLPDIEQLLAAPRPAVRGARMTLVPPTGALYFTVVNPGAADRLLRVETPVARAAEPHESIEDRGMMRMVAHRDGFAVPAGGTLELKPAGKHLMLLDVRPHPAAMGPVPVTLHFERAGAITVAAEVASP